jgi:hypothetical protein
LNDKGDVSTQRFTEAYASRLADSKEKYHIFTEKKLKAKAPTLI